METECFLWKGNLIFKYSSDEFQIKYSINVLSTWVFSTITQLYAWTLTYRPTLFLLFPFYIVFLSREHWCWLTPYPLSDQQLNISLLRIRELIGFQQPLATALLLASRKGVPQSFGCSTSTLQNTTTWSEQACITTCSTSTLQNTTTWSEQACISMSLQLIRC
jgi:hypothetical protein